MTTERSAYVFDAAWKQERERLGHLEAVSDPGTIRHLEAAAVGVGWRCAEIGAGTGSIAEWLSDRSGSDRIRCRAGHWNQVSCRDQRAQR